MPFLSGFFSVLRFESVIHEFDPWFNYRATRYYVEHGFDDFINWFDERAWYPLGRIVGGTVYPGLMFTSGLIYWVCNTLHFTVHIREICVFLAPLFSGLAALATYLLTAELKDEAAGLLAATFLGIAPGYISRSVAGSYDNEGIAIFALVFTFYLWIRAVKTGSMFFGAATALSYFYMVGAWGGYVFITNMVPLHVLCLLFMGRYSSRLYVAYCTFAGLGHILSMQIPFVGTQPMKTNEHMALIGVFGLLQIVAFGMYVRGFLGAQQFRTGLTIFIGTCFVAGVAGLVVLTSMGYIQPWTGRFYSLWDTGYAKVHIPIIASVSEHQPTTWTSFFIDLQMLIMVLPVGVWCSFQNLSDASVFMLLYALTASYFAGVMVRLMLTLTPVVCILAAVAFSTALDRYCECLAQPAEKDKNMAASNVVKKGKEAKGTKDKNRTSTAMDRISAMAVLTAVLLLLTIFSFHCTYVTSNAYSSPSIVLASSDNRGNKFIIDDFREAYHWLSKNTADNANIMAWWDYGYQIGGMSNRTTLVDNNTWNNTHIAQVGLVFASNEVEGVKVMRRLDVNYVLVIFGGLLGYSGDDINKFLWMVRIAEGEYPAKVKETDFFSQRGEYRVDDDASETMKNSLMYSMSYYRFNEVSATDRVRNTRVSSKPITFKHIEEVYTTENWLVRIYKLKPEENRQPPVKKDKPKTS